MSNIGDEVKKLYGKKVEVKKEASSYKSKKSNATFIAVSSILLAAVIVMPAVYYWNQFVRLHQTVLNRQGHMDKEYQRRNDLIPNLIELAKDYAQHERELFKYVSDVKAGLESAEKMIKKIKGMENFKGEDTISKMMALAEQYPDLKATQSFQELMDKLEEQENRLADTREAYNNAAQVYNIVLASFPSSIYNMIFKFTPVPYFQSEDKRVVKIDDIKSLKSSRGRGGSDDR